MKSRYFYCVSLGYVAHVRHRPGSETRQCDLLFPAIFSLVSSLVVYALLAWVPGVELMMYANNLIIFFPFREFSRSIGGGVCCVG